MNCNRFHRAPPVQKRALTLIICFLIAAGTLGAPVQAAKLSKMPRPVTQLVPLGHTAGIRLSSDGVIIVGLTGVPGGDENESPGKSAGLRHGDIIVKIGDTAVTSSRQLQELVNASGGRELRLTVRRGEEELLVPVKPLQSADGGWRLGIWVRDNMLGIGTLTFFEPESGTFGALGHGISDPENEQLIQIGRSSLVASDVRSVKPGLPGEPGELQGSFNIDEVQGQVMTNTRAGIFGVLDAKRLVKGKKAVPVAKNADIVSGPAQILANVEGEDCTLYDIRILRLYPEDVQNMRNMLIEVTDQRLLARTGGIVQGMSGSPILQNGRLIGAVTHVLVNDPQKGYGIFIENMLAELYTLSEQ